MQGRETGTVLGLHGPLTGNLEPSLGGTSGGNRSLCAGLRFSEGPEGRPGEGGKGDRSAACQGSGSRAAGPEGCRRPGTDKSEEEPLGLVCETSGTRCARPQSRRRVLQISSGRIG